MANVAGRRPKRAGQGVIVGPSYVKEFETCTCFHCNVVWVTRSTEPHVKTDLGGWCQMCMRMICASCSGKSCLPFEKKLELYERRDKLFELI